MEKDRTLNLLAALSLRITDLMYAGVKSHAGLGGETSAALVTLGTEPGISINTLRQILGLSHPGTVRLIDRLEAMGMVERKTGKDGRTRILFLTETGKHHRKIILERRRDQLRFTMEAISDQERAQLAKILEKILRKAVLNAMDTYSICRLCEDDICPMDRCPVEQEYNRLVRS